MNMPVSRCTKCGVYLNSIQNFDNSQTNFHVCNQKDIDSYREDWENFIKKTRQKQSDILKLKEIDENQLNISMDI